jgi:hypothetical protein
MESKPVNKHLANYLREKLVKRSGAESAVAKIVNGMSDAEVISMYHKHTALQVAKLEAKS